MKLKVRIYRKDVTKSLKAGRWCCVALRSAGGRVGVTGVSTVSQRLDLSLHLRFEQHLQLSLRLRSQWRLDPSLRLRLFSPLFLLQESAWHGANSA